MAKKKLSLGDSTLNLMIDILRHDLINPVSAIRMTSDVLSLGNYDEKTKKNLEAIKQSADQEIQMIRDTSTYVKLLLFTEIKKEKINLNLLLKKIIETLNPKIEEKKIKIKSILKSKVIVLADLRIEVLFSNLLSNAIKYSPLNGKIELGINEDKTNIRFYIKDNGPGIKQEYLASIFERFSSEQKQGIQGSGLGLAIVKKLAEMHKGKVWVELNPSGGSIFYLEIPKR